MTSRSNTRALKRGEALWIAGLAAQLIESESKTVRFVRPRAVPQPRRPRPSSVSSMSSLGTPGRRVAIIAGVRTPFARAGTAFKDMTAIELGKRCVAELISAPISTEISSRRSSTERSCRRSSRPTSREKCRCCRCCRRAVQAYTVSRACASANQAITDAADQIVLGHHDVMIAGGAESLSNVPILHSRTMSEKLVTVLARQGPRRSNCDPRLLRPTRFRSDHAGHRRAVDW